MSGKKTRSAAKAAGAAEAAASAGAAAGGKHQRQWTHTALDGSRAQRLHRAANNDEATENTDMKEEEEEETAAGADEAKAAAAVAAPSRGSRAAAAGGRAKRARPSREPDATAAAEQAGSADASAAAPAASALTEESESQPLADADSAMADVAAAPSDAAASAAVTTDEQGQAQQEQAQSQSLPSLLQQLYSYAPAGEPAGASGLPPPPFELFTTVIAQLRATIQTGETHVQMTQYHAPAAVEGETVEDGTEQMSDAAAAATAATPALEIRSLLHHTRVHFASCYPLPPSTWLEWLEDVQSLGSGVETAVTAAVDDDGSAEAAEAREDAAAASEQLFLVSLFRISLSDYASPQLWDAFLSYVTRACDSVLRSERAVRDFRLLSREAIFPRGVLQEQRRRAAEKKEAARLKKEAAQSGNGAAAASNKQKKKQAPADGMDERSDVEDESSSSEDEESDDDEDGADEWSDEEDDEDEEGDAGAAAAVSPFAQLHPALAPLIPLPYSRSSVAPLVALPSAVPVCHSYTHGDGIFQKLRGIEMQLLTRMMQRLKRQQDGGGGGDDDDTVDEDDLMEQMERVSRLYRIELTIPLRETDSVYHSLVDWLSKQGDNESDPELAEQHQYTLRISQTLAKKFEDAWAELEATGAIVAGVGVLTPQAQDLFDRYLDFLSQSSKSRQRCKANPAQLYSVLERILAVAFLDANWWTRFVSFAEQFAGRGVESARYVMQVAQRALRNCPWDARIATSYFHSLEALQALDATVSRDAVEAAMAAALANQSLQSNVEGSIEVRLQVIGYYRRTLLSRSNPTDLTLADALAIRSHFVAIRRVLPYLSSSLPADRASELVSRVYQCWVELECSHLFRQLGDGVDEDAHSDAEAAARKAAVPLHTYRARQLYQQYVDDDDRGSVDARPWLDWSAFEQRSLSAAAAAASSSAEADAQVAFIRGLFRQGVDRITGGASFSMSSSASLAMLAPLLQCWLDFELLHSSDLAQLQQVQRRCSKYTDALKTLQAQETWQAQQQQLQQQQQQQATEQQQAAEEAEGASLSWVQKPLQPKAKKPADAKPAAKSKGKAAKEKSAADKPATDAAATGNNKKRKRDESQGAAAPAAAAGATEEPASKKSNTTDGAASTTVAAPPAAPVLPAHTVYVSHLPWTLREAELRAMFAPFGNIKQLVSHKASKTPKRIAYVEVRYASDDECAAVEQQLQGKELQGKKIHIARTPPKSEGGDGAASAHGAAGPAAAEVDEADPLSVFVKNLPRNEPDIAALVRAHFESCGEVVSVDIPKNAAATGAPAGSSGGAGFKNFGTVVFRTPDAVPLALAKHMSTLGATVIAVVPNQAPAREKRLAAKMAAEAKRKPAPSSSRLQFMPRITAIKAAHATTPVSASAAAAAAPVGPGSSNDDFRAMLLAGKK